MKGPLVITNHLSCAHNHACMRAWRTRTHAITFAYQTLLRFCVNPLKNGERTEEEEEEVAVRLERW